MTLRLISATGFPAYTALSTDISGSAIKGAVLVGKTVYTLDTQKLSQEPLVPVLLRVVLRYGLKTVMLQ